MLAQNHGSSKRRSKFGNGKALKLSGIAEIRLGGADKSR